MKRLTLLLLLLLLWPVHGWTQGQAIPGNRTLMGTMNAGLSTGTSSAYVLTLDPPITQYVPEQFFVFRAHTTNVGPATLTVNAAGARQLKAWRGTTLQDLGAGEIRAGQEVLVYYDGTTMQLLSGGGSASAAGTAGTLQASTTGGGLQVYPGTICPESTPIMTALSPTGTATCQALQGTSTSTSAPVLVTNATSAAPNGINLGGLATGLLLDTVSSGLASITTVPYPAGDLVGTTATQRLDNKFLTPRRVSLSDAPTITLDLTTFDLAVIPDLSQATTFANPTGMVEAGQLFRLQVHSTTAQPLSWGTMWSNEAGFPLPTTTSGGATYDMFWFQYNASTGRLDHIYNSQLSQLALPSGVSAGTYTCPVSVTVDARGKLTAITGGTCGGGGGGGTASAAGDLADVQFKGVGTSLAADSGIFAYDAASHTLVVPNIQTSIGGSIHEYLDARGYKGMLKGAGNLGANRLWTLPAASGEVCLKEAGNCGGGGGTLPSADDQVQVSDSAAGSTWRSMPNCVDSGGSHLNYTAATNTFSCGSTTGGAGGTVAISGSPAASQVAEWVSGSAITGVTNPSITALRNLTGNGLVGTSGSNGTLGVVAAPSGAIVGTTDTQTMSNKRVTKRVTTLSSSTTYTCPVDSSDVCEMQMTAASGTITIAAPTGTPQNADMLMFKFLCTSSQTLSWNTIFVGSPNIPIPTSCPAGTTTWTIAGAQYSTVLSKWQIIATN